MRAVVSWCSWQLAVSVGSISGQWGVAVASGSGEWQLAVGSGEWAVVNGQ